MKPYIDADISRLLRAAAWMWLGYLAALSLIDAWLYLRLDTLLIYYLLNGSAALAFLLAAYWEPPSHRLSEMRLPVMLILLAIMPLIGNHLLLVRLPPGPLSNPEGMALRQLPILFLALIITAWQYRLAGVLAFSGATALIEVLTVVIVAPLARLLLAPAAGPPGGFAPAPLQGINVFLILGLVRTISFAIVGVFVNQLIERLNQQQQSLQAANARLAHYASTLESLAISRERNRLAHELHDTLAHSLSAIAVQLETARAYWEQDSAKARALVEQAHAATRSGLEETRRALKALRASPLDEVGLLAALRRLAESAAARAKLDLTLTLPDHLPVLAPDIEQAIYRIAQEALENVVAHAHATRLTVRLTQQDHSLCLAVQDNGRGFRVADLADSGHFGLIGMRERARMAGGELDLASAPGHGTTVILTIGAAL
ncbi:sensor histidine kinase [Chloroflexus sp.]|uniref:sensor histidine kinase n=1 Tax=Chloroflexus sp. TaxID=1904827 RepID=UPI00298ED159|nr:sensor histidine kinase [Chloroflexus sp.]MDW8403258.1 sensor histidine kinase [Chloroflexus sp.]